METAHPIADTLKTTLATLELSLAQRTTQKPPQESFSETKRRDWLARWLRMDAHHQQLRGLENSVYQFCVDYAARPQKGYRMIIYGENGSGKSHAAKAIAKWANMISMKLPLVNDLTSPGGKLARCEYHSWPQSVNRLKGGEWDLVDCMTDPELLVLDDVGAEHDPSKMGVEKLYLLLEQREKKWTVITTNTTPAAWAQRFERRIASRFFRNAKHVALDQVPDYGTK